MGGSGGGGFVSRDPKDLVRDLDKAQAETRDEAYEASVNQSLTGYLASYNDRDREAIARHLGEITRALGKELAGTVDIRFGGSVAKHTYVDGLSDVDSLVMLDSCELADRPPLEAKYYLAARLRERFPQTPVEEGTLAVTVHFSDIDVQLLPAVSCRDHVKIADETGRAWAEIHPRAFTSALTKANENLGGKVVSTIKLAKGIIGALPDSHRISGYHAESLAIEVFRDYTGPRRLKDMLKHFFTAGADRVLEPIRDRTGQSVHVDDYLGAPRSIRRRVIADAFGRMGRRMKNADAAASVDQWEELFGG